MSEHTKGEWQSKGRRVFIVTDFEGYEVNLAVAKKAIVPVAVGVTRYDAKAARANARLMASAPNLLAALECSMTLDHVQLGNVNPEAAEPIFKGNGWDGVELIGEFVGRLVQSALAKAYGDKQRR